MPFNWRSLNLKTKKITKQKFKDGSGELSKTEFIEGAHQDKLIIESLQLYHRRPSVEVEWYENKLIWWNKIYWRD